MPTGANKLYVELRRLQHQYELSATDPKVAEGRRAVSRWQSRRLARTYADLAAESRYASAVQFFQADLYGGKDYRQRDTDLERVVPVMNHLLPEAVIDTVAAAMELNALSQELDLALWRELSRVNGGALHFTVGEYCDAYRAADQQALRIRQIALIGRVGTDLEHYVSKRMIRAALTMMRKPARLAGLGTLQSFLERGFAAFGSMGPTDYFLSTIATRETTLMNMIFGGESSPFPDPMVDIG